ncbi:hypothetical protein DDE84_08390 [Bifidobacterium tibiigranuli]|jgi:5-methylthioadenosine/S-adenosylhomocysteine deaminase|uniref:Amidohydrolase-related domain-containing protein n=2 Tax=Bifidobacterium TaxID=1678 RepID=A0A5N6RZZ4_9BIFI|nr:hypothetical protein DDE84_08390 [Bifidobacterium tibiigranuli]KAE8127932.1 hypothetical protein DDF78_07375 [Bifidobacterium tibiigranuli]
MRNAPGIMGNEYWLVNVAAVIEHDGKFEVRHHTSIHVVGNTIAWIGDSVRASQAPDAEVRVIDAHDAYALPGFINTHVHSALLSNHGRGDDYAGAPIYQHRVAQGIMFSPDELAVLAGFGAVQAALMGSTTIVDNYEHEDASAAYLERVGIRCYVSERVHDADLAVLAYSGRYEYQHAIREQTLSRQHNLEDRYAGNGDDDLMRVMIGPHGPDTCSRELLAECSQLAKERQQLVAIHLSQGAHERNQVSSRDSMDSVELLESCGLLGPWLLAGHCLSLPQSRIARLAQAGTNVIQMVGANLKSGCRLQSDEFAQAGANVCVATDNMMPDMLDCLRLYALVNRLGSPHPDDYDASRALASATINPALAIGRSHDLGRLTKGYKADIVLIEPNPVVSVPASGELQHIVYNYRRDDIRDVIVNGEFVVKDHAPANADLMQLRQEALRIFAVHDHE